MAGGDDKTTSSGKEEDTALGVTSSSVSTSCSSTSWGSEARDAVVEETCLGGFHLMFSALEAGWRCATLESQYGYCNGIISGGGAYGLPYQDGGGVIWWYISRPC